MYWLKQPIADQLFRMVVQQPMGLVNGTQRIGYNNQYRINQLYWLTSNQLGWSGVTNTLVKTTNIWSTNQIGCQTTIMIGQA